ncbi:hypothetical protein [Falsiroseomonas ponticola]|uniref:hypothetical protein n=1 Tax=Falsiroseomonas ponticola TaxID=2786951 RepID=UPI0019339FF4|nr:hypothetical protein [Roseomonas ponticola]
MEAYSLAAIKHFSDAKTLAASGRFDGGGYLVGYVVECALKHALRITVHNISVPRKHIPELIAVARMALQGRGAQPVLAALGNPAFMAGWSVGMRYAGEGGTDALLFRRWENDARKILLATNIRCAAR